jgi:Mg-chelatase subunit ChlD
MSQPAAVAGTIPAKPAQQVALGAEVTTLNGQAEGGRDRKLAEPSKKTEASVVRAGKPTEVGAADQLKESEKTFAQQTARVDELRRNSKLPEAKTESEKAARELDQLQSLRASVDQRIAQEKADSAIPKAGSTALFEPATAEGGKRAVLGDVPVLGRLFKNGEERVAKLEVVKGPDVSALMTNQPAVAYDPYFTLSEADLIRSQKVLGNVVDDLKLDQKWGEQEGRKLDRTEALERLKKSVTVQEKGNGILEIHARDEKGAEAAQIANKVAEAYQKERLEQRGRASQAGVEALTKQVAEIDAKIAQKKAEVETLAERGRPNSADVAVKRVAANAAIPQPEISTAENAFSTFSLNVSDVSFKLAAASLEKGLMPEAATVRSEEFINAFDYRDPEPQGAPIGFVWERARYPFAQGRDLLRFSVKTAASGRQAGKPLNLVLLLDSSGSMERADRVRILQECLKTLAAQLRPEDKISVVAFARTARLWIDGLPGSQANELAQRVGNLNPEGGTNLEEAMKVAYETARKHFNAEGVNRVVLLTDGAANLGDVEPESLKRKVESERKKGVALDCFGIGWEGLNDELLETLSRNGDGRYGFVNTPEAAASEFAGQLAGALNVAASDVKVQVEWNPKRVTAFRQIGYAKHQLTKEQFRDNTVDAAEIGAAEAGNALYVVQVNAAGEGPLGTVRVRFKVPGTNDYREHAWPLNYEGASKALENANYTLRLAGAASAFSEWLVSSPYAAEVTTDKLLTILSGVPEHFAPDPRPTKLEWMIRQAKSLAGK